MNEVSQALALQQAQLEPVSAGSAAVALTGLVILPFEPFTGATLLAAGMGVSGASVVRGLAQSKQVAEGDLADAKGKLQELNVRLEGERQKAVEAHEREETLAFENRQLQRAVLGGSLIVASLVCAVYEKVLDPNASEASESEIGPDCSAAFPNGKAPAAALSRKGCPGSEAAR
eukprot:gene3573-5543_t